MEDVNVGVSVTKINGNAKRAVPNFPKVSFRDKVVGVSEPKKFVLDDDLDGERLAVVHPKTKDSPPRITFTEEGRKAIEQPYLDAIVIKVLGKHFSYTAMVHRLKYIWRLKGGYEILDVGSGYFMVKCDLKEDKEKILIGGPWMIDGFYLAVKPWNLSFKPSETSFGTTIVWIRITGMNISYYGERAMKRIASGIGNPIKVDGATKEAERGKYARACVQIDLGKPVITEVIVDDSIFQVEYESLHLVCKSCNCYGHVQADCNVEANGAMRENFEKLVTTNNEATNKHYEKNPSSHFVFGNNHSSKVEELPKAPVNFNRTANNQVTDATDVTNKEEKEKGWTPVSKKKAKIKKKVDNLEKSEYISSELGTMKPNFFHMGSMKFQYFSKGESSRTNKEFPGPAQNKSATKKPHMKATISRNSSSLNLEDSTVTPTTPFRKRDRPPSLQGSPNLTDTDGPSHAQPDLVEGIGLGKQEPQVLLTGSQFTDIATVNA